MDGMIYFYSSCIKLILVALYSYMLWVSGYAIL